MQQDRKSQLVSAAQSYIGRGWVPIRLKAREKIPPGKHDANKLTAANAEGMLSGGNYNIGVMLGSESGGLVDLDFDWPEARKIGELMFNPYPTFGRRGAPGSHRLLHCDGAKSRKFSLPAGVTDARLPAEHALTVLEIRASGLTMFPPSIHPNGENVEWENEGDLRPLDVPKLAELAGLTAFSAVVARFWPQQGTRDETAMALASVLLSTGIDPQHVDRVTQHISRIAGDEEWEKRTKAKSTAEKLAAGEPCTGLPRLVELLGLPESCCKTLRDWVGLRGGDAPAASRPAVRGNQVVLDPSTPMESAREFIIQRYSIAEERTLVFHKGEYFVYEGGIYRPLEHPALIGAIYDFTDAAVVATDKGVKPFKPNQKLVNNIEHALRGLVLVQQHLLEPPCWIKDDGPNPKELLVCRNGLLHLPSGELSPHTPRLFALNGISIDYDPGAPSPERWLRFLREIFPGDDDAAATLQEIMGYLLTPETLHQKVFMLVAPPRSGKGTIARVIEELVGSKNFAGIKLKQLGDDFGQQSLIGKLVAVVTDARVGSKVDKGALVETILTISGEDTVNINRKNLPHWQGKLSVRFFLHTNELPQLEDMSGALASRFILLTTEASFLGREDHTLGEQLKEERAGILLWAIEGYRRLRERGRFAQPKSSERMLQLLAHMSSPIASFVEERCELDPAFTCPKDTLYGAYREWLADQGRSHVPTKDVFSTKLYAAFPTIGEGKGPRDAGRKPEYRGIKLFDAARGATVREAPARDDELPF